VRGKTVAQLGHCAAISKVKKTPMVNRTRNLGKAILIEFYFNGKLKWSTLFDPQGQ